MRLKSYRLAAHISQINIVKDLGVTYQGYQRWESGLVPIPKSKLEQLARILDVTPEDLLKEDLPTGVKRDEDAVRLGLKSHGSVAIRFVGDGAPLLLSISETAFSRLNRYLVVQP